jgi:DNA ligase (NAD+)
VVVVRAGEVIPKIVLVVPPNIKSNISSDMVFRLPSFCPACGSPTARNDNGVIVRCTGGIICPAQALERLR